MADGHEGVGTGEESKLTDHASQTPAYTGHQTQPGERPPPYEYVVGRYRDLKAESRDHRDFVSRLGLYVFCNTVVFSITFVFCVVISIANIIIGAVHLDDCPRNYLIPIYLIVGGCVLLLRGILNSAELIVKRRSLESEERYQRSMVFVCCDLPLWVFLVCWFILGNFWIFGIKNSFQSSDPTLPGYCNYDLYWYAFWTTILAYILMLIPLVMCCCVSCIACLAGPVSYGP